METYLLKTKRLGLRRWKESDYAAFREINQDPMVMEFFPRLLTPEESDAMIEKIEENTNKNGFGLYAVELLKTKEFIGFIGLSVPNFDADFTPCVEIGWRLAYSHWGKGYAPEGAQACIEFAFHFLKISEIVSFTSVKNERSIRVMEKLNMKKVKEFMHPNLTPKDPLCTHVLYKIQRDSTDRVVKKGSKNK
ncbi:GNAT family N-acetyltransferase [Alkaliphilus hydrothermalis]|uniref:3-dehydroquinate dehydratase/shikimate dehydrogenase n=1 Tax=Alkaliphilus hydrothermalis TaxID=1482730 RepID=A0ABS2NLI2_9FIRM|nr:GNAT family N-acetyltransferase [Alkaliphilus hydrothermalis]MBM7613805.1 3-dehydroquinate dehydratase/shikimate dehydrogenase [Alkaliphilus hydrothermalis]